MANQHVVPNNGQWQVKRENANRATKTFNTQKEAIEYGRNIAIRQPKSRSSDKTIIHICFLSKKNFSHRHRKFYALLYRECDHDGHG